MKISSLRGVALLALLSLMTVGCSDGSPTASNDAPAFDASEIDELLAADPLFRFIGPRFTLSTTTEDSDGLLVSAADIDGNTFRHAARRLETLESDEIKRVEAESDETTVIDLSDAGMRVVIPAGALSDDVDITVQAYAGKYHVYEFLPHGIQFEKPIRVEFDIANVREFGDELEKRLEKLQSYDGDFEQCGIQQAQGDKLSDYCQELFSMWADYNEDADWYKSALSSDGFVGVYFQGDVHGDKELPALEIFGVTLDEDGALSFHTTHFSGYALGM